jgi:hypothetical protein
MKTRMALGAAVLTAWVLACSTAAVEEANDSAGVDGGTDGITGATGPSASVDAASDGPSHDAAITDAPVDTKSPQDGGADVVAPPTLVPPALDGKKITVALGCTKKAVFCHCTNVDGTLACDPWPTSAAAPPPTVDTWTFSATVPVTFTSAPQHVQLVYSVPTFGAAIYMDATKPGFIDTPISLGAMSVSGGVSLSWLDTRSNAWFDGTCGCATYPDNCAATPFIKCGFPPLTVGTLTQTATTLDVTAKHRWDLNPYGAFESSPEAHFVTRPDGVVEVGVKALYQNVAALACDAISPSSWWAEYTTTLECTGEAGP